MIRFKSLLGFEWKKLMHHKKYLVFMIILGVLMISGAAGSIILQRVSDEKFTVMKSVLPMNRFAVRIMIPLMVIMGVSDLFPSEYHDKTIRAILTRPVNRAEIWIAKSLSVFLMSGIFYGITAACSWILQFFPGGRPGQVLYILAACLLDWIAVLPLLTLCTLLAQTGTGPSLYVFISIALYVLAWAASMYVPYVSNMLYTSLLQWHDLWLGETIPFGALMPKIGLLAGCTAVFGSAGYLMFENREF